MERSARVFVAGAGGMVGSAIVRRLKLAGHPYVLQPGRSELDLSRQSEVDQWFARERPTHVFLAAAKVGGILANDSYPADFIRDNLQIQTNVIDAAWRHGVTKLLFLGSSCIYPKLCPQPIREDYLLTGPLESTNEWYALAKIAGVKMCQAYRKQFGFDAICAMPTNLYGPGDNFDLATSHVLPALVRKFLEAKRQGLGKVVVWGSGTPRREFLFVDDLADACLFLMQNYSDSSPINVGCGEDVSIRQLADLIAHVIGYDGELVFDSEKPDGTPRKLLDVTKLTRLGWRSTTALEQGIAMTVRYYESSPGFD